MYLRLSILRQILGTDIIEHIIEHIIKHNTTSFSALNDVTLQSLRQNLFVMNSAMYQHSRNGPAAVQRSPHAAARQRGVGKL